MRLNRIQLSGFKSFRSKSAIEFGEGITAIVGPNGCGKSNIVDAIRWAMGTQSARSLRGSQMADVIFSGSGKRKPSGLAEVELRFRNDDSKNVVKDVVESPVKALVESSSMLSIGRRLFRGGDADYSINGVSVRLKDIRELFLGTGASVRGYSIIAQGQIEFLINARPTERRLFVEEIAGVTKYRYHRDECERKLQSTEVNLERLEDLIAEIRRYIAQLKHQSRKAQRYVKLKEQKRHAELLLLITEHDEHLSAVKKMRAECADVETNKTRETQRSAACETALRALRSAVEESRTNVQQLTENVFRLQTKEQLLRQAVGHASAEQESLSAEAIRLQKEDTELVDELGSLKQQNQQLTDSLAGESEPAQRDTKLEEIVSQANHQLAELENNLDGCQSELERWTRRKAEWTSLVDTRRQGIREAQERQKDAKTESSESLVAVAQQHLQDAERRLSEVETEWRQCETNLCDARARKETSEQQLNELKSRRDRVANTRVEFEFQRDAISQALDAEVSQGARKLLDAVDSGKLSGILGLVNQGIKPEPGFEKPVHGVLRDMLEYLVVEDSAAALSAIEYATEHGLVVGCVEQTDNETQVSSTSESLLAHVDVADWIPAQITQMLNVACVIEPFCRVDESTTYAFVVDNQGTCCSRSGFWRSADPAGGALARRSRMKDQLDELNQKISARTEAFEQLSDQINTTKTLHQDNLEQCQTFRAVQQTLGQQRLQAETIKARAQAQLEAKQTQLEEAKRGAEQAERQLALWTEEVEQTLQKIGNADQHLDQLTANRTEWKNAIDGVRTELGADRERLAEQRAIARQQEARLKSLREDLERVTGFINRAEKKREQISIRSVEVSEQQRKLVLECEVNRGTLSTVAKQLADANNALTRANGRLEHLKKVSQAKADELQTIQAGVSAISNDLHRISSVLEQSVRECERLEGQLKHQHGVTLDEARKETSELETEKNPFDLIEMYERSIARLGPINHTAPEELEQAEERFGFLCQQQADLVHAIEDLGATISELDRASKTSFTKTFESLNKEFQALFARLFKGGEAELSLTDDIDPLEAGVEVMVRPPGKRVRCMSLLSGGEKALTAIALVFAAFRLNPSPFCVLDEVDAPLDEHNVAEYIELIRELSQDTQFLVITHNRRTMEGADKLVGVTMEEPGISRLVTVNAPSECAGWEHERAAG